MSTTELLCKIIGVNPIKLTKKENLFLEAELFIRVYEGIRETYKTQFKEYIERTNLQMEENMLEGNFIRCLINDILLTEEYSIQGIACYTQTPEEVIYDIASGTNLLPSLALGRKIIEIHRSIRPNLYQDILKKISM